MLTQLPEIEADSTFKNLYTHSYMTQNLQRLEQLTGFSSDRISHLLQLAHERETSVPALGILATAFHLVQAMKQAENEPEPELSIEMSSLIYALFCELLSNNWLDPEQRTQKIQEITRMLTSSQQEHLFLTADQPRILLAMLNHI